MNKLIIYIVLVASAACLGSCYKDLGNYDYHAINEVTISGIDTVNGYTASFGDTLLINPVVTGSQDPTGTHKYSYQWSFFDQIKGDQIISTNKTLNIRITQVPGSYTLQYKVTDSATGVLFHTRTTVLVKTDVYEGYLVMNEVAGNTRLDMLSYDVVAGKFTQYTDVLKKMGSSLPPQGQPYKVVCTRTSTAFNYSDSTYGIYVITASGTNRINSETFDWRPTYNIRYEVAGNIPQDFKADNMVADPAFYFITIFMVSYNNVYLRSGGVPLYNLPLNKTGDHQDQQGHSRKDIDIDDGGARLKADELGVQMDALERLQQKIDRRALSQHLLFHKGRDLWLQRCQITLVPQKHKSTVVGIPVGLLLVGI